MRQKFWLSVMLLALIGVIATATVHAQANNITVELQPSSLIMIPGGSDVVDVWVRGLNDSQGLEGYDITLRFDPRVVRIDEVTGGDGPFGDDPTFTVDHSQGILNFSAIGSERVLEPAARVAQISLSAVGVLDDSSPLTFAALVLRAGGDDEIATATGVDNLVTIASAGVRVGSATLARGETKDVPVTIVFSPEGGLAGYNIAIGYDSSVVNIDRILPGEPPFGGTPIFSIDEPNRLVNVVGFHGNRPGPSAPVVVLQVELTGIAEGFSPLKVTVKDLVDAAEAQSWPAVVADGLVRVERANANLATNPSPPSAPASRVTDTLPLTSLEGAVVVDVAPSAVTEISSPNGDVTVAIPAGTLQVPGFVVLWL